MDERFVPCKYCGKETAFIESKLCHNCWEVSYRIHDMPLEVIEKIIADRPKTKEN